MNNTNRDSMKQKTDFNNWSISYLTNIHECAKCKKRNNIICNNDNKIHNCMYCGNPYIVKKLKN